MKYNLYYVNGGTMKKFVFLIISYLFIIGVVNAQISRFTGTWEPVLPAGTGINLQIQFTDREAYFIQDGQRIGPISFSLTSADTLLLYDGGTSPTTFRWISDGNITMLQGTFNPAMSFRRIRR